MIGVTKNLQGIKWQVVNSSINIPVLVMLINPSDISANFKKIITRTRTKGGFAEEHWGNDLNSLQVNGKTAMFYNDKGLTTRDRRVSEAMANFYKLVAIYRNNAVEYNEANELVRVGRIRMFWESRIYDGFFESFNINEESEDQFVFTYDFSFKILKSYGGYNLAKVYSVDNFISVTNKPVLKTPVLTQSQPIVQQPVVAQTSTAGIPVTPELVKVPAQTDYVEVEKKTEIQTFDIPDELALKPTITNTNNTANASPVGVNKNTVASNAVVNQVLTKTPAKSEDKKNTGQLKNVQSKPTTPEKKKPVVNKPVVAKKPPEKKELAKRDPKTIAKAQQQTSPPKESLFKSFLKKFT